MRILGFFEKNHPTPGARPGTLALPEGSPPPMVKVTIYGAEHFEQRQIDDLTELESLPLEPGADKTIWIDVQGLGEAKPLRKIAAHFGIHPLALEDAVNLPQRPKQEQYEGQQLIVARVPREAERELLVPQVAIVVGAGYVVTFQERYLGFFDQIRERIRIGTGPIRTSKSGYLAYALIDALVDHFFPVLERIAADIDELEDEVFLKPRSDMLQRLHRIRRWLTTLRRVATPQRDVIRDLLHYPTAFLGEDLAIYLRDTHDHAAQLVDVIDSTREVARSLVDMHMSGLAHRQNEVMKVLTLMASLFIPLTFIAGIYGMNFENMPELKSVYGYFFVLGTMGAVAIGMLAYFWRKGWIGKGRE